MEIRPDLFLVLFVTRMCDCGLVFTYTVYVSYLSQTPRTGSFVNLMYYIKHTIIIIIIYRCLQSYPYCNCLTIFRSFSFMLLQLYCMIFVCFSQNGGTGRDRYVDTCDTVQCKELLVDTPFPFQPQFEAGHRRLTNNILFCICHSLARTPHTHTEIYCSDTKIN